MAHHSCAECGYVQTAADLKKSFKGKFCPKCGARRVMALEEENLMAENSLLSLDALIAKCKELITEPTHKNLGFKILTIAAVVFVLQAAGYEAYSYFFVAPPPPLVTASAAAQADQAAQDQLFSAAMKLQTAGNLEGAKAAFTDMVTRYPDSTRALNSLGFIAKEQQDTAAAKEYFQQSLVQDPANVTANQNLGVLAKAEHNTADAQKYFTAVLQVEPTNDVVKKLLATVTP